MARGGWASGWCSALKVGQELASRGHEFIVVNTDYDGKQMSRVDTEGITELLYQQCVPVYTPLSLTTQFSHRLFDW
jgi:acetylglutamate kinase